MTKTDRQVQRTRELLQKALIELISERNYDAITVQDIVDHANLGRTTFYLHYTSKEELFMSCHQAVLSSFHFGALYPHSPAVLLAPEAPPELIAVYRHLEAARGPVYNMIQRKEATLLLRRIRDWSAKEIEVSLRAAFGEADSHIPLEVLANYLAGAQIALLQWWLEKRVSITPEGLAQTFHRLQRAAIHDAFGVDDNG